MPEGWHLVVPRSYAWHYVMGGPWPYVNGALLATALLALGAAVGAAVAAGRRLLLGLGLLGFAAAAVAALFLFHVPGEPGEIPPPPVLQAASFLLYLLPYVAGLMWVGPALRRLAGR